MLHRITMLLGKGRAASSTYATWDPAAKGTAITLSNGNLTTVSNAAAGSVRSTISKAQFSGKFYWEVLCNTVGAYTGVCSGSAPMSSYPNAASSNTIGYSGQIVTNGFVNQNFLPTCLAGDVIGVGLDTQLSQLQFFRNGSPWGTAESLSGLNYPLYAIWGDSGNSLSATTNFGATPLIYMPSGGYSAGLF